MADTKEKREAVGILYIPEDTQHGPKRPISIRLKSVGMFAPSAEGGMVPVTYTFRKGQPQKIYCKEDYEAFRNITFNSEKGHNNVPLFATGVPKREEGDLNLDDPKVRRLLRRVLANEMEKEGADLDELAVQDGPVGVTSDALESTDADLGRDDSGNVVL